MFTEVINPSLLSFPYITPTHTHIIPEPAKNLPPTLTIHTLLMTITIIYGTNQLSEDMPRTWSSHQSINSFKSRTHSQDTINCKFLLIQFIVCGWVRNIESTAMPCHWWTFACLWNLILSLHAVKYSLPFQMSTITFYEVGRTHLYPLLLGGLLWFILFAQPTIHGGATLVLPFASCE